MFRNETQTKDDTRDSDIRWNQFKPTDTDWRLDADDKADMDPRYDSDDPLDDPDNGMLHKRLLAYYAQELYAQHDARRVMAEDEAMFDGDQWSEADKAVLAARGQQPLVFNVIAPAINWMLGTEARSRTQFKVLPRRKDGARAAERKSQLMKYLRDVNHGEFDTSRAYADAVKVGIGWLEEGYQGEGEEEPVYTRYESWRNMVWDSRGTEKDLKDSRYIFRAKWTDMDVAKKFFPERAHHIEAAANDHLDLGGTYLDGLADEAMDETELFHERAGSAGSIDTAGFGIRKRVRLIEGWYITPAETKVVKGGQFNGEVFDPLSEGHTQEVMTRRATVINQVKMRVHVAVFTSTGLLYADVSPYRHNRYPFTPVWGNRRGSDGMPYGLIRSLADIQRDLNKRASKALHILSSSKIIMEEGAVKDLDELAEEAARPDGIIVKKPNKYLELNADRELAAPHMDLMSRDIEMIQQQSGITDEAMGRTTNANSGKAIIARQTQGSVATNHFLDNLRFAMRIHGEKQLSLIEQYYDDEKEFRITNTRGTPEYVQVNDGLPENDIIRTKADFIIAEDDWKATIRQAQTEALMDVVQQLAPAQPQIVMLMLDLLVESMDVPYRDELVARIRQLTGMEDPDADPDAQDPETLARQQKKAQEAEMQARAAQAELAEKEASAREKGASAEYKAAQALKTQGDARRVETQHLQDELAAGVAALQSAIQFMQARPAVPLADRIIEDARRETGTSRAQLDPMAQPAPDQSAPPVPPAAPQGAPFPPQTPTGA